MGVVQVKVIRAEGLMAADVTGKTAEQRGRPLQIDASILFNRTKAWEGVRNASGAQERASGRADVTFPLASNSFSD